MRFRRLGTAVVMGVASLAGPARGDVLNVAVNGTSNSANVSGSSLPDLVDDLIKSEGKFKEFDGQAYNASLKYGDVNNAITLDANAAGTDVTLRIPSTGLVKRFTGSSADDVQDQIKDFLLKDGSKEYAKFIEEINKQSLLGVVDGNPRATTAMFSDHAYRTFGLNRVPPQYGQGMSNVASNFRVDFEGGVTDNDEANETYFNGAIGTAIAGENIGVTFTTLLNYRDVDGSSLFSAGFELGVPIAIIPSKGAHGLSWQVTPVGTIGGGASYDLAAGGTMWGLGVTSALSYQAGPLVFTLANQYTHYEGFSMDIGEYEFDTNVSQNLIKNGVGVAWLFGPVAYLDGSLSITNFLDDAAIDQYWTPSVGFGLKFGHASGIHFAYKGDFADDYRSHGGEIALYFGY